MKHKKKLRKMEEFLTREYETAVQAADRFLDAETYSFPCGNSPGMFISEILQAYNDKIETDPFSAFAAKEDDLMAACKIYGLSGKEESGAGMISLMKRHCRVSGRHCPVSDNFCIQIRTEDPDICYSLSIDADSVFAANVFIDSLLGRCFMIVEAADSDSICMPLNGIRLLSVDKQGKHGECIGLVIEYAKPMPIGIYSGIVCGPELKWNSRFMGMDKNADRYSCKKSKDKEKGE